MDGINALLTYVIGLPLWVQPSAIFLNTFALAFGPLVARLIYEHLRPRAGRRHTGRP